MSTGALAREARVSIQLVNPDPMVSIRVTVDGQEVFIGKQVAGARRDAVALPIKIEMPESMPLPARRFIVVEADTASHTKAKFEWDSTSLTGTWIVVSYYPGRTADSEPPFFTFSVQKDAAAVK